MKIEDPDYQFRTIDTDLNNLCLTFYDGMTWKLLINIPMNEHIIIWDNIWENKKKIPVTIAICKKSFSPLIHEGRYNIDEEDGYLVLKNNTHRIRHIDHKMLSGNQINLLRWDIIVDTYKNILVKSAFGKYQVYLNLNSEHNFEFKNNFVYLFRYFDLDGIVYEAKIPNNVNKYSIYDRKKNGLEQYLGNWLYKSGIKSYLIIETYDFVLNELYPTVQLVHF